MSAWLQPRRCARETIGSRDIHSSQLYWRGRIALVFIAVQLCFTSVAGSAVYTYKAHIAGVAVSPDGQHVAAGGTDGLIRVFDMKTGRFEIHCVAPGKVNELRFLGNSNVLLASCWQEVGLGSEGYGALVAWDLSDGRLRRSLRPPRNDVGFSHFIASADGALVAARSPNSYTMWGHTPPKPFVSVWTPANDEHYQVPLESDWDVRALALSPDGRWIVAAQNDRPLSIWDTRERRWLELADAGEADGQAPAFSADGQWLAVARGRSFVELRRAPRFSVARTIQPPAFPWRGGGAPASIDSVAFAAGSHDLLVFAAESVADADAEVLDLGDVVDGMWAYSFAANRLGESYIGPRTPRERDASIAAPLYSDRLRGGLETTPTVRTRSGTLVALRTGRDTWSARGTVAKLSDDGRLTRLWTTRLPTTAMAFSPTDPHVVVCAEVKRAPLGYYPLLRLRDAETGKLLRTFSDAHE